MLLYLMRHGKAVNADVNPERPLSPEGREIVAAVGKKMNQSRIRFNSIVHSTKLRAKETASIVSAALGYKDLAEEWPRLEPDHSIEPALNKLEDYQIEFPDHHMLLVGHLPFIPKLIRALTQKNHDH